jgi:hypothetical protein
MLANQMSEEPGLDVLGHKEEIYAGISVTGKGSRVFYVFGLRVRII